MRHDQGRAFSLLATAIFLLAWSHCGGYAGAEKQACFHDINLDLSINSGNEASDLDPEMGLFPGRDKMASLEPGLLLGNPFRDLSPSDLHCKNCQKRAPPNHFPTERQTIC